MTAPDHRSRAWVEIDLRALRTNYETVRRAAGGPDAGMIAMVKADGYGLGAERVVRTLEPLGPRGYGVATAEEGRALRRFGVTRPIIVFSPLPPPATGPAAQARLTASVSDLEALDRWAEAAEQAPSPLDFHVEIDTGMGRSGFDAREAGEWGGEVRGRVGPELRWTGAFTHFHSADAAERTPSARQWQRFRGALDAPPVPADELLVHAANSAAAIRWPEYTADAVRPGIFLYGGDPAPAVGQIPDPRPVAALRARIIRVREVPPGTTVGYGATYSAGGRERWATLAIGYGDGLPRVLGNRGHALVAGRRVPIIGRLSMDLTVVELPGVGDVRPGDTATLIGSDGDARIALEDVAAQAGTISYEILTGLSPRLPRVEHTHADTR